MHKTRSVHWSNRPWPYWVGLSVLAAGISAFGVDDWSFLNKPISAAWVQAIGTLVALGIAFWVPWHIHQNERSDREAEKRLQGQGIAYRIEGSLRELDGQLERVIEALGEATIQHKNLKIELPNSIKEQITMVWLLGPVGNAISHLVGTLEAAKTAVEEYEALSRSGAPIPGPKGQRHRNLIRQRVEVAREDIKMALEGIDRLLDSES